MRAKTFLILICFSLSSMLQLSAQPPGYLGKRLYISGGVSMGIATNHPDKNNRGGDYFGKEYNTSGSNYGLNLEYNLGLSFVTARQQILNFKFGTYQTGLVSDAISINLLNNNPISHDLFYRLSVQTFQLDYGWFSRKRGALSPLGGQYYLGLKLHTVSGDIIDKITSFNPDSFAPPHSNFDITQKVWLLQPVIGWSNTMVFFDQIVFRAGINFGIPMYITENYNEGIISRRASNVNTRNQDVFENDAMRRIYDRSMMQVDISIGYLLF